MPEPTTVIRLVQALQTSVDSLQAAVTALDQKVTVQNTAQIALQQLVSDVQAALLHVQDVIGSP